MRIIVPLMLMLIIFIEQGCKPSETRSLRSKKAAGILFGSKKQKVDKWELWQTYDPYNKGYTYSRDSLNPRYLELYRNGRFQQYDSLNQSEGKWFLNVDSTRIALVYKIQNGQKVEKNNQERLYRYQVIKNTTDSLILGVQGRHGILELTYLSVPDSIDTDTIPAKTIQDNP